MPFKKRLLITRFIAIAIIAAICTSKQVARGQLSSEPDANDPASAPIDATAEASARTPLTETQIDEIVVVRQLARQRGGQPAALAQIIQMSREFDDDVIAELIDELAAAHLRAGDLNLAADARRVLTEQYPNQPMAHEAILWLVRLYASSEMVHSRRQLTTGEADIMRQLPAGAEVAPSAKRSRRKQSTDPSQPAAPYAIHLASQAMATHPKLSDNPALAYQRAVAARLSGKRELVQAYLSPLKRRRPGDPWGDCARMEAWLEQRSREKSPKPTATVAFADQPPELDGVMNDPCWHVALPIPLKVEPAKVAAVDAPPTADGAIEEPPPATQVQLAYDREYLYVAVVCAKAPGVSYQHDDGPRPRDGDVERHDHVSLRIDLDRDYASYYDLLVDNRGWTADRCWGDAAWNPKWFVAASPDNAATATWAVEMAIPWAELTPTPPKSAQAWACSIDRVIPGAAGQSWIGPAAAKPGPESFGVVEFE